MKIETICKRTKHLTYGEMPAKAGVILLGMTNNPHFPEAGPLLAELAEKRAAMTAANLRCMDGGRLNTAHRKVCRRELERALDELLTMVKVWSHGDVLVALSSGFELRKPPLQLPKPEQPSNVRARTTACGQVELRCEPIHGVRQYAWEMNLQGPQHLDAWEAVGLSSRAKRVVVGLPSASIVWFRLFAVNASGVSTMSAVVRSMVY